MRVGARSAFEGGYDVARTRASRNVCSDRGRSERSSRSHLLGVVGGLALVVPLLAMAGANPASAATIYTVTAIVPVGQHPSGVAVDPTTGTAYVTNYGDDTLSLIDESTDTVTATVPVGIGEPEGVAVDPITDTVYVTGRSGSDVSVIDGATNAVTDILQVGHTIDPDDLPFPVAVDPATDTVYVANWSDNTMEVIDGATNTVTATVAVGYGPTGVAVDPSTDTVYVSSSISNSVSVIDGATDTVTATVAVGSQPGGVAVDPSTDTVYVTNTGNGTVSVIDGATDTVTDTVAVGSEPFGVDVDPSTGTAYETNYGDNTVSVIDEATNIVTTMAVGGGPVRVAVDPDTDTAYAVNRSDETVSVITSPPGTPGAPSAVAGDTQATVTVAPPGSDSGGVPTSYTVTAADGTTAANGGQTCTLSGASGSCTVTGLTNGDSYTFTSTATNAAGTSSESLPSNAVVPQAVSVTIGDFAKGSTSLTPALRSQVRNLANEIESLGSNAVTLTGYQNSGPREDTTSGLRATHVEAALERALSKLGVTVSITAVNGGTSNPVGPQGSAANRRVVASLS